MQEMDEQIIVLLYKRISGQPLEEAEIVVLECWLTESSSHQALLDELIDEERMEKEVRAMVAIDEDAALKKLQVRIARDRGRTGLLSPYRLRYVAAALLTLALIAGVYSLFHLSDQKGLARVENGSQRFKNDITPGGGSARLELADGSTIVLDSVANGIVKNEGGTLIRKRENSLLVYDASGSKKVPEEGPLAWNTIITARKSRYTVLLPDGSKVWLNAASSLRFPVAFNTRQREVELSGEAYFEVASLAMTSHPGVKLPFIVKMTTPAGNTGEVEVQGTRFNINAYPDETTINTTLVDGRVLLRPAAVQGMRDGQRATLLVPGQQAKLSKDGSVRISNPDIKETIAWKDSLFIFHNMEIEQLMRMVSRWYGVDIIYEAKITETFNGEFSMDIPLSQLLADLELTGSVFFTLEGKKLTVKSHL